MNRLTPTNRYQHKEAGSKFTLRGVSVARLLVGLLLALNLVLVYSIFFSSNGLPGYRKQNRQVKELEGKVLQLKVENQKLFEMIQALKTSPRVQEKLVRQELGWVHENEIILESAGRGNEGGDTADVPIKPFSIRK